MMTDDCFVQNAQVLAHPGSDAINVIVLAAAAAAASTTSTSKKAAARKPDIGLLEEADLAADFPGLLNDDGVQGGSLLPGTDAFDFPPVPMELYGNKFQPGSL